MKRERKHLTYLSPAAEFADACIWTGISGKEYIYHVYEVGSEIEHGPGNYVLAKLDSNGLWQPIYIDQADDLSGAPPSQKTRDCVARNKATHIHIHFNVGGLDVRLAERTDIGSNYNTSCNE